MIKILRILPVFFVALMQYSISIMIQVFDKRCDDYETVIDL